MTQGFKRVACPPTCLTLEEAKGRMCTFALWRILFVGSLCIDLMKLEIYTDIHDMVPHFQVLMEISEFIPNVLLLTLFLRSLSFACAAAIFLGVDDRPYVYVLCAASTGFMYAMSILDSFQHHYLFVLVMLVACHDDTPARHIRTHEILLGLMGIVYGWTTVTKLTSPKFMTGEFLFNGPFANTMIDKMMGLSIQLLVPNNVGLGLWLWQRFVCASAWIVILVEGFLCVSLIVKPLWRANTLLMLGLHALIGMLELIEDRMHTDLFSVYMFGLAALTIPPLDPTLRWMCRVLPSRLMRVPDSSTILLEGKGLVDSLGVGWSNNREWSKWMLVLFFTVQLVMPLRCYAPVPWAVDDDTDERFCWRMFSDNSMIRCAMEWHYRNEQTHSSADFADHSSMWDSFRLNKLTSSYAAKRICQKKKRDLDQNVGVGVLTYQAECYLELRDKWVDLTTEPKIYC